MLPAGVREWAPAGPGRGDRALDDVCLPASPGGADVRPPGSAEAGVPGGRVPAGVVLTAARPCTGLSEPAAVQLCGVRAGPAAGRGNSGLAGYHGKHSSPRGKRAAGASSPAEPASAAAAPASSRVIWGRTRAGRLDKPAICRQAGEVGTGQPDVRNRQSGKGGDVVMAQPIRRGSRFPVSLFEPTALWDPVSELEYLRDRMGRLYDQITPQGPASRHGSRTSRSTRPRSSTWSRPSSPGSPGTTSNCRSTSTT